MMSESQIEKMERWFGRLSLEIGTIKTTMATKEDLDKLYGLIERVHRRLDQHLGDDDKDKRIFRLAFERLEEKVEALQGRI